MPLNDVHPQQYTVSSKINRALEIIRVKKLVQFYIMQFYKINTCQVMIFRLYSVYKKHELIKIGDQTREKPKVLSQVLE